MEHKADAERRSMFQKRINPFRLNKVRTHELAYKYKGSKNEQNNNIIHNYFNGIINL